MIVKTLNSAYQLNGKKVRRLSGKENPTPRMGEDGEWKTASEISEPVVGHGLVIVWRVDNEDGVPIFRTTQTSLIVSIEEDTN